ncbi:sulfotransferase [Mechercharimyces sp. CAU 1602]|nr:sulfotransferase [Mechercharimyces sp. CAU 1602]
MGGEGRSGTTLMRIILDSHPHIACGPETGFFVHPHVEKLSNQLAQAYRIRLLEYDASPQNTMDFAFGQMLEQFHVRYMKSKGKRRWADKTPKNILSIPFIHRCFPDMKFIHLIRDGRDAFSSHLTMNWGTKDVKQFAQRWTYTMKLGRQYRSMTDRYIEVKYEDLVLSPEETLQRVMAFLEEPWDDALLRHHQQPHDLGETFGQESSVSQVIQPIYTHKIGRWKTELTEEQLHLFMEIAADEMRAMGYEDK